MPLKNGRLTARERQIARAAAANGENLALTAHETGSSVSGTWQALQRPAVRDLMRREVMQRLAEGARIAVETLIRIASDPEAAGGHQIRASEVILKHALKAEDGINEANLADMTPDQMADAIQRLRQKLADQAKPVIDQEPSPGGLFE